MSEDAPVNIGALVAYPSVAEHRVLKIQTKLHCWTAAEADRRFDDLFNLVVDPAFLVVAWNRVRSNKGARTAGIDAATAASIESRQHGVAGFLAELECASLIWPHLEG
jgi:RNA-directed DNA polymerase